jgi:acetone carboxylase gamma subunit
VAFAAGAGYGNPIERDSEAVRTDVEVGDILPEAARDIFRVALAGAAPAVDHAATAALRQEAIVERLGREPRAPAAARPPVVIHVTEYLDLVTVGGSRHLACARCGSVLCAARENYKAHALRIDQPIQAANPLIGNPQRFIDAAVQFRQFYCPACGGLIENEVSRAEDPLLRDIELAGCHILTWLDRPRRAPSAASGQPEKQPRKVAGGSLDNPGHRAYRAVTFLTASWWTSWNSSTCGRGSGAAPPPARPRPAAPPARSRHRRGRMTRASPPHA